MRRGHYGAWRLACAVPAALTSAVLVTIVAAPLGRYTPLGPAEWLLVGFLLLGRWSERAAVRAFYRLRVPAGNDRAWLEWLQAGAEHRCRVHPGRLDWYLRDDPQPNAFAAGRRSVAVTSGFLHLVKSGRLSHDQAIAVVIHEIGHHATGGTRYGLLADWLCWPWQAVYRAVMRLSGMLPYAEASMLLLPVIFTIAIVRTARLDAPPEQLVPVLALLVTLTLGIFAAPVGDAALARASERAADRYTTRRRAGVDLAAALHSINPCRPAGLLGRLHNRHPSTTARVDRLTAPRCSSTGDVYPLPGDSETERPERI